MNKQYLDELIEKVPARYIYRGRTIWEGMESFEWRYGSLVAFKEDIMIMATIEGYLAPRDVGRDTIGQCTGLKDKDGDWIFEGDILEGCSLKAIVCWLSGAFIIWDTYLEEEAPIWGIKLSEYSDSLKIIGNKTDNPELLEVEDEEIR